VHDLDRAAQWCQRLARMSAEQNVRALRAVCRAHYGSVLMLRGEWEQAEVELTDAAAVLAHTPRLRTRFGVPASTWAPRRWMLAADQAGSAAWLSRLERP